VDNQLSRLLLDGQVSSGNRVLVDTEDGELTFRVDTPAASQSGGR
jgi:ATP-dependent Clp protease ATP-binding subunit ClpC